MKVLNLQCAHQHSFEGWFASEGDFQSQLVRGLVECPMCSDKGILKMPSAPRLNFGALQAPQSVPANRGQMVPETPDAMATASSPERSSPAALQGVALVASSAPGTAEQAAFLLALRHVIANTEDVGKRFADEARRMHYGDAKARNIRGQTSAREAIELLEEGIEVMPLLLPDALKETLQ